MKHIFRSIYSFLFSIILILTFFSSQAFAEKPTLQYVALGDSLAAGFLNSQEIGDGYPVYIKEGIEEETAYHVNLINRGVGGYTTVHLLEQLERGDVQQELAEADFITIDIGANDILWTIGTDFDLSDPDELQRIVEDVSEAILTVRMNVAEILSQIQQLNPDAPIFFMGYYNALPYLDGQDTIEFMMTIFNNTLKEIAESFGTIFVPTYDAFDGKHDIYLPNPLDIHPTKEGYEVIASLFLAEILPILPPVSSILEITLYGDNPMELEVGDTYVEPDASAHDSIDGDLTDEIEITGEVNTNEAGTYTLTYSVTNSLGETASAERMIHVMKVDDSAKEPPPKVKPEKPQPPTKDNGKIDVKTDKKEPIVAKSPTLSGEKLPSTATTYPTIILIGVLLAIAGSSFLLFRMNVANSKSQ